MQAGDGPRTRPTIWSRAWTQAPASGHGTASRSGESHYRSPSWVLVIGGPKSNFPTGSSELSWPCWDKLGGHAGKSGPRRVVGIFTAHFVKHLQKRCFLCNKTIPTNTSPPSPPNFHNKSKVGRINAGKAGLSQGRRQAHEGCRVPPFLVQKARSRDPCSDCTSGQLGSSLLLPAKPHRQTRMCLCHTDPSGTYHYCAGFPP